MLLEAAALLIGLTKTGFGSGTGLLVTPIMVSLLPSKTAVGVMLPLLMCADAVALKHYWGEWRAHGLGAVLAGAAVGVGLGGLLMGSVSDVGLRRFVGAAACFFAVFTVFRNLVLKDRSVFRPAWPWGLLAGIATGVVSTLAHVGGVVVTMYLLPQQPSKRAFVATSTAVFASLNLIKLAWPYIPQGLINAETLLWDLKLLPGLLVGAALGLWANWKVPGQVFVWIILGLVIVTGGWLLLT